MKEIISGSGEQNRGERLFYIDLLEFLAMLFVLLYHSNICEIDIIKNSSVSIYLTYSSRAILSTGVPLFFFVNGYLLFNRGFELKKHIFKMIKLILLTGIWGGISLIVLMLIENEYMSIKDFLVALWTWKDGWINHLWFMGALICIYIFFPVLKNVYDTNKKIFVYFIVICAIMTFGNRVLNGIGTIFLNLGMDYKQELNMYFFNIFDPFRGIYGYTFVYFCVGGLMYIILPYLSKFNRVKINCCALLGICISTICLAGWGIYCSKITETVWDVVWNGYDTIFTFGNVIFIFVLCLNYKGDNAKMRKVVNIISRNTIGIYFLHTLFIRLSVDYVKQFSFMCNLPGNLVYALLVMFICMIFILGLKKIPLLKKLV